MPTAEQLTIPANPSDVACVDFVNSQFSDHLGDGLPVDRLADRRWQAWFLDRYRLLPKPSGQIPVDDMTILRRDLRRILEKWSSGSLDRNDVRVLDRRTREAALRLRVEFSDAGVEVRHEPVTRDWAWVAAAVAASAAELMTTGEPARLKVCANPACSWMFYDRTHNASKQFCSTTPCASLMRVRRFRRRG